MKNMRKLASVVLALVLALGLMVPAFATTVTIQYPDGASMPEGGTANNVTYTAYKIFDATIGSDPSAPHSYTITHTEAAPNPFFSVVDGGFKVKNAEDADVPAFTLEQIGTTGVYNVKPSEFFSEENDAAALSVALEAVITDAMTPAATATASANGVCELSIADVGYYLIVSSLGEKMVVDTVSGENMTVYIKNQYPTLDKVITEITNGHANDGKHGDASYGSLVTYRLDVAIPATATSPIVVHDSMDAALTYGTMTKAETVVGEDVTDLTANVTAAHGEGVNHTNDFGTTEASDDLTCTMEFTIPAATVAANQGKTVSIYYTATLNRGVATGAEAPHNNTAYLTYNKMDNDNTAQYTSARVTVDVKTYEFDLIKTKKNGTQLEGAEFKMYNGETPVKFSMGADGSYQVDPAGTVENIKVGKAAIKGLANGTYTLDEVVVPEGYNKITAPEEVTIANANNSAEATTKEETVTGADGQTTTETLNVFDGGVQIVNLTGAELPSTGGIGTTIFYVVGGILVAAAAVLLITKKRVSAE